MHNIYNIVFQRAVDGHIFRGHTATLIKINLVRDNVSPLNLQEHHSTWPVGTWRRGSLSICVLFDFEDHEEFLEDLFFCGQCFDAVLTEYHYIYPSL